MGERKRWAVSALACRPKPRDPSTTEIQHHAFVVEAHSRYEAVGIGVACVRKIYPPGDGWRDYHADARPTDMEPITPEGCTLTPWPAGSPSEG